MTSANASPMHSVDIWPKVCITGIVIYTIYSRQKRYVFLMSSEQSSYFLLDERLDLKIAGDLWGTVKWKYI